MPNTPINTENHSVAFQNRILVFIHDLGMNQKEFAEYLGVSQPVVSHIIKYGIIPSVRVLIRMADKLAIPLNYLLGKVDNKTFYPSANPSTFHQRLRLLKDEKHLKYGQIAQKMTFPKDYFYEWQRLKTFPSLEYLEEIAKYFNVSLDYLVGRSDDKQN